LKEYEIGSHMSFIRNPNFRGTTTINGVEYQLPFLDEIVYPIMPDESTQLAAFRTGTISLLVNMPATTWGMIEEAAPPGVQSDKFPGGDGLGLSFDLTKPPFNDRRVRRALMVGTDMEAFSDLGSGGFISLAKDWFPIHPSNPLHIPLERLPTEIRLLYDYDPVEAKNLLADAGYTEGLTINFHICAEPLQLDMLDLLMDMWAKIGVEVEPELSADWPAFTNLRREAKYTDSFFWSGSVANPLKTLSNFFVTGAYGNYPRWSNEHFDELMAKAAVETDTAERDCLMEEASLILLEDTIVIPFTHEAEGIFWWPWMRNYYGEIFAEGIDRDSCLRYVWIDQDLKAEMGY